MGKIHTSKGRKNKMSYEKITKLDPVTGRRGVNEINRTNLSNFEMDEIYGNMYGEQNDDKLYTEEQEEDVFDEEYDTDIIE